MISKRTTGSRLSVELQVTTGGGGGWQPYNSTWTTVYSYDQYGEPQASEGHPLHQYPSHASVSCEWERQDYQRYNDWGDEDFRHYSNIMTQFADTQDRANSMASPTSDLRDSDVVGNNPVVPDSSREQIDLDQKLTTQEMQERPVRKSAQPRVPTMLRHQRTATHSATMTTLHHRRPTAKPLQQLRKKSPSRSRPERTVHRVYTRK